MISKESYRPFVIILAGMSIDGRISLGSPGSSRPFDENLPDKVAELLRQLRAESDAVMVGINTVEADNPSLRSNDNPGLLRVIVDSQCRVDNNAKVISDSTAPTLILTTNNARQTDVDNLRGLGVEVLRFGDARVDLAKALNALRLREVRRLLVEGGARLIGSLLKAGLVDEFQVVIFPFIVGDRDATPLVEINANSAPLQLQLLSVANLFENHLLLRYRLANN